MKTANVILLLITLIFTGCVHSINQQGVTIKIPASQITASLEEQFPITKSFDYGQVTLKNPKALLRAGSDKVQAGTAITFSNALIPQQSGSLFVSGKPYFDAKSGAIFLHQPTIESLEFNGYQLNSLLKGPVQQVILSLVQETFKKRPIYKLNQNALQNSFINNIIVSNGELLVTFGL